MANPKKNSNEETSETSVHTSAVHTEESDYPTDESTHHEEDAYAASPGGYGYEDRRRSDELTRTLLAYLSKHAQTDESIRRTVKEAVDAFAAANRPAPVPVPVVEPAVKGLKDRLAVLRTFYPATWL